MMKSEEVLRKNWHEFQDAQTKHSGGFATMKKADSVMIELDVTRRRTRESCDGSSQNACQKAPSQRVDLIKELKRGNVGKIGDVILIIRNRRALVVFLTVKEGRRQGRQKKEVGRQHQGTDRPGVRQVPEGSGEQREMEETGCEVICGGPTTPAIKGQMQVKIKKKEGRKTW